MSSQEFVPVQLTLASQLGPALAVELLPHGFTTHSILLSDGRTHDIVQGPFDPSGHAKPAHKYQNTIVGRYANRLPATESGVEVQKNGFKSIVKPAANEKPTVSLHGGPNAMDSDAFTPIELKDSKLFSSAEIAALPNPPATALFTITSPAGHNGYPGTLLIEALTTLIDPPNPAASSDEIRLGSIVIVYRAKVLEPGIVTPVNLTQHWGFNLEFSADDKALSVKDHRITIHADNILELDSTALATGKLIPTKGTAHEHVNKRIGDSFPKSGYDDFYLFTKSLTDSFTKTQPTFVPISSLESLKLLPELLTTDPKVPTPLVELLSDKTGFKLAFTSNQSGVQFYTANFQEGKGTRKKIHGGSDVDGEGYPIEAAAFLEFHEPIGSYLHPHNGVDTLLTSDEIYHNYVRVDITQKVRPAAGN